MQDGWRVRPLCSATVAVTSLTAFCVCQFYSVDVYDMLARTAPGRHKVLQPLGCST